MAIPKVVSSPFHLFIKFLCLRCGIFAASYDFIRGQKFCVNALKK